MIWKYDKRVFLSGSNVVSSPYKYKVSIHIPQGGHLQISPFYKIKTKTQVTGLQFYLVNHRVKNQFSRNCVNGYNVYTRSKKKKNLNYSPVELILYPSPYLEPLLRSFLLGISVGALFELVHYIYYIQNNNLWPHPNLMLDHFSAFCSCIFFYLMDVKAINIILQNFHGKDPVFIANKIDTLTTFPKRLLPWKMFFFKKMLIHWGWSTHNQDQENWKNNIVPFKTANKDKIQINSQVTNKNTLAGLYNLEHKDSSYYKREEELALRKKYLKNFWYAAAVSSELKSKPLGVEIVGKQLVLFRDFNGVAHALSDVCPHRGAPLHDGWTADVESNTCIVCPYHGWAFDNSGILCDVPAAVNSGEIPRKKMLVKYIIEEKGGFIWFFNGSNDIPAIERPPIPYIPELDDKEWKAVYGSINFDCPHWSVFENAIDMAHIHYLHAGTFGNQSQPKIKNMHCHTDFFKVSGKFSLHNKPANPFWNFAKIPQVDVTALAYLPSTSVISFTLGNGLSFITFVNTVPIDKNRSCNRFALVRRLNMEGMPVISNIFNNDLWDKIAVQAMLKILTEDKAMVESLTPQNLKSEISVKADMIQLAFRKLRNQYIKYGFGQN